MHLFFFFGHFLMTKMPQITYLHMQRSLRVTLTIEADLR